jgi:hypothetical protein
VQQSPEWLAFSGLERTVDFVYPTQELIQRLTQDRRVRNSMCDGVTTAVVWPAVDQVLPIAIAMDQRFCQDYLASGQAVVVADERAWMNRTLDTIALLYTRSDVRVESVAMFQSGQLIGAAYFWVEGQVAFTCLRFVLPDFRQHTRQLVLSTAERCWVLRAREVNDGPALGNSGLFRFKRELCPHRLGMYAMNIQDNTTIELAVI